MDEDNEKRLGKYGGMRSLWATPSISAFFSDKGKEKSKKYLTKIGIKTGLVIHEVNLEN